jgi:hypothetical protein
MTIRGGTPPPYHFFRKDNPMDFNPMDYLKGQLVEMIAHNAIYIALGVAGIAVFVAVLRMATKLVGVLFTASLNAGETLARQLTEKPKAAMLALSVFSLAVIGLWAWHTFSAPKIIKETVIEKVPARDETADAAIAEARGKYGEAESARSDAEVKTVNAEARAKALENQLAAAEQARKQAETHAAEAMQRLHELSLPEGDETALERLKNQFDGMHADGVATETASISDPFGTASFDIKPERLVGFDRYGREAWQEIPVRKPQASSRNYRSYSHKKPGTQWQPAVIGYTAYYHRSCSICDQNCRIRQSMDEIYPRLAAAEKQRKADEAARKKAERDKRYLAENGGR